MTNDLICFNEAQGGLLLSSGTTENDILLDGNEHWGVIRAATDLADDFRKVTGSGLVVQIANATQSTGKYEYRLPLSHNGEFKLSGVEYLKAPSFRTNGSSSKTKIIAGTLGRSQIIDDLVIQKKLDVSKINNEWESFVAQVVQSPIEGVDEALVIAGSDKRGTIFGLYTVSEQIGVSPFYWWADVEVIQRDSIYVLRHTTQKTAGPPSIKYRGFFLNDEMPCLTDWAKERFPQSKWGSPFNHEFYSLICELLLRAKANYLWPCMWASMFHVDDPLSPVVADAYGVVMGTSHTEPLMRATHEWPKFGKGDWAWDTNRETVEPYFEFGLKRAKNYENIYNLAMRGYDDFAMDKTKEEAVKILQDVVANQRRLISKVFDDKQLSEVPQMWCLYKEVLGYFEEGMSVPEDVILLWSDDNWGNIRRLPIESERSRPGGAGLYYHFDYVGDPRNYKWINNVSLQRTFEQLNNAHKYGADKVWIVNVGDLKPMELPLALFFDLAYDINKWNHSNISQWVEDWATRYFGDALAKEIGHIARVYSRLAAWRKYELLDPQVLSVINYREAETALARWQELEKAAKQVYDKLSEGAKPSFFQILLHPIKAGHTVYRIHVNAALNNLYAEQFRNTTNHAAQKVLKDFDLDKKIADEYHNLLGGKWNHFVSQTHIGYKYWQQPYRDVLPPLEFLRDSESGPSYKLALAVEGSIASVPGDDRFHDLGGITLNLPPLEPYGVKFRYIEVFSRSAKGTAPVYWALVPKDASVVNVSPAKGVTSGDDTVDTRAEVSINWSSVTGSSLHKSVINFFYADTPEELESLIKEGGAVNAVVEVPIINRTVPSGFRGFVESDGHVSIEASNFTESTKNADAEYIVIDDLGKTGAGVTLYPEIVPTQTLVNAPKLSYNFYSFEVAGEYTITVYTSPSLNIHGPNRLLKYAIAVGDEAPQSVEIAPLRPGEQMPDDWEQGVADNIWKRSSKHKINPGKNVLSLAALEANVVFQKIVIDFGGVRQSYFGPPQSYKI